VITRPAPPTVESRGERFAERAATRIWSERPSSGNPFLADQCLCHGYDLLELVEKRSFPDMLFLLLQGELPNPHQAQLLSALMVALSNPGPRHPATRAVMNAAVSRTKAEHLVPIGLSLLGGEHLGGAEVAAGMRFLRLHRRKPPEQVAGRLLENQTPPSQGDVRVAPGFGTRFGGVDPMPTRIAARLAALPAAGTALNWGCAFAKALEPTRQGWLVSGVAAAALLDLGFPSRAGAGLFQIMCAPGILAHGIELSGKPLTAMPFVKNDDYVVER
jgi:citrate synthase